MEDADKAGSAPMPSREAQMETIVAMHETALLRYATRLLNNAATAQDVVQNVFIKFVTTWTDELEPSPRLKSWLYSVTHNEAVDHIRRESRLKILYEKQAKETADAAAGCPDGIHCESPAEERKKMVLGLLQKLHPREQQVVLLRMEQGLSYKEISEITGRTEGNVGNLIHHAVRKLSDRLRKAGVLS